MTGFPEAMLSELVAVSAVLGKVPASDPCDNCPSRTCDGPMYGPNTTDGGNCVRPISPTPRVIEGDDDLIPF